MFVCLLDELILGFCYSDLTLETGGFELASTITLVLQENRLTKCATVLQTFLAMTNTCLLNCVPCGLITCSLAQVHCVLICSRFNMSYMLTCSHANVRFISTCPAYLHTHVSTRLASSLAHVHHTRT